MFTWTKTFAMFVKVFHGLLTGKMCRSFYEGLFRTHADSFYFLCTSIIFVA